jgi:hypothetical protein
MQTVNKKSRFIGVTLEIKNNGKDYYWVCRVQRKKLRFKQRFPYTERGEQLAGEMYQKKIQSLTPF